MFEMYSGLLNPGPRMLAEYTGYAIIAIFVVVIVKYFIGKSGKNKKEGTYEAYLAQQKKMQEKPATAAKYVLASASPRRIDMMRKHGYDPLIIPAEIDEDTPPSGDAKDVTMRIALKKATAVEREVKKEGLIAEGDTPTIIIAADTVVYANGEILGKPENKEDALRMLMLYSGTYHEVTTGVALIKLNSKKQRIVKTFEETAKVYVKEYTEADLKEYLEMDEAYDKAGAYAIQGYFGKYIDHVEGDPDTVMGFPFKRIEKEIKAL